MTLKELRNKLNNIPEELDSVRINVYDPDGQPYGIYNIRLIKERNELAILTE